MGKFFLNLLMILLAIVVIAALVLVVYTMFFDPQSIPQQVSQEVQKLNN